MPQSLIIPRSDVARGHRPEKPLPWKVVFWVSAGLTLLGWLDVGFLWAPLQLADLSWRFNVIAATIDALPLATIGLTAWLVAAVQRESHAGLMCVVTIGAVTCALLLVLGAWFVASGMRMQSPGTGNVPGLLEIGRTSLFALIYLFVYAGITGSAAKRLLADDEAK